MRFGDAEFPRQTGVFDARKRTEAPVPPLVAGNQNMIGDAP